MQMFPLAILDTIYINRLTEGVSMTDFQKQFFARLHIEEKDKVSFEDLPNIMYAMAQTVPFENLNVLEKNFKEISKRKSKRKNFSKQSWWSLL